MTHENFPTKPCVFTAPDTHTAYMYIYNSDKLKPPKTFMPIIKSADREESA